MFVKYGFETALLTRLPGDQRVIAYDFFDLVV